MNKEDLHAIETKIPALIHAYCPEGRVISVQPAKSGYHNPVFIVEMADQPARVVRVLDGAERWKARKEALVYDLLAQQKVPAARVLKLDSSRMLIPYDYLISEKLVGSSLSSQWETLRADEWLTIYTELGEYLARIHAVTFDQFGDVDEAQTRVVAGPAHELAGFERGPFRAWKTMFMQIIAGRLQSLANSAFADLCPRVANYFQDHLGLIDYAVTPRLLHLDLHGGNLFVHEGHITGILDVEEALIGHNEYDLMRTELGHFDASTPERRAAFFAAYTRRIPLDAGYAQRRNFYQLSRTLVQARCLVQLQDAYSEDLPRDIAETRADMLRLMAE